MDASDGFDVLPFALNWYVGAVELVALGGEIVAPLEFPALANECVPPLDMIGNEKRKGKCF